MATDTASEIGIVEVRAYGPVDLKLFPQGSVAEISNHIRPVAKTSRLRRLLVSMTRGRRIALCLSIVALPFAILGLYAGLDANVLAREANALSRDANWLATEANQAAWDSYNATFVGLRMALIQLCADHPDISPKCSDIKAWSGPNSYLETGPMVILHPDYQPNSSYSIPAVDYQPPKLMTSREGAALVTGSAISGMALIALIAII